LSSGMSVMSASMVSSSEAIAAAFSSATRSTFGGSMMPACVSNVSWRMPKCQSFRS
jgi:hypothetical protein